MFLRTKRSVHGDRAYEYLQICETFRDNGRVKQRTIATLGKLDDLSESGQLEALAASFAKFSRTVAVIGEHDRGALTEHGTRKLGPGMVFERLWKELGIGETIRAALRGRKFQFDVEAAIFLTVVHRLMDPGSDRAAEKWREDYVLPEGVDGLDLHHLYRAMAWLGEPLSEVEQAGRTPFSPRCTKDLLEERLFLQRRDLFTEVAIIFFDTTSIYFEGAGGQTLGRRGHSKDHRPDLPQVVVGLVLDGEGRPLCCELWPGNTTDVKSLVPIVDRLQRRFHVKEICVVADRGMISKETVSEIERRGLHYILGARMRRDKEVRDEVLARGGRYQEVTPERKCSKDPSPLKVKEVVVDGRRYVVCLNDEQARKDAGDRAAILAGLEKQLRQGDKSLVGNKGFRKYLRSRGEKFEIDWDRAEAEARYDGKWVLRTNVGDSAETVARTYKMLWMVEALFRTVKSVLETRPIYHKCDETIRGHVFCSFLALLVMRELQERMDARRHQAAEWADVLRDLDSLSRTEVASTNGKRFQIRSEAKGWCGKVFQAVGVALPPTLREVST
jgi:transposase